MRRSAVHGSLKVFPLRGEGLARWLILARHVTLHRVFIAEERRSRMLNERAHR